MCSYWPLNYTGAHKMDQECLDGWTLISLHPIIALNTLLSSPNHIPGSLHNRHHSGKSNDPCSYQNTTWQISNWIHLFYNKNTCPDLYHGVWPYTAGSVHYDHIVDINPISTLNLIGLHSFLKGACSDPQPHPQTFFKHTV